MPYNVASRVVRMDADMRARVEAMLREGYRQNEVARALGMARSAVGKVHKAMAEADAQAHSQAR